LASDWVRTCEDCDNFYDVDSTAKYSNAILFSAQFSVRMPQSCTADLETAGTSE